MADKGWKFSELWAKRIIKQTKLDEKRPAEPDRSKRERRTDDPRWFWGVIWDSGPDGEDDFTNENYWFKRVFLDLAADGTTPASFTVFDSDDDLFIWDELTNEGEHEKHTHKLKKGQVIQVWWEWDDTNQEVGYIADLYVQPIVKRGTVITDPKTCNNWVMVQPDGTSEGDDQVKVWLSSPHEHHCPKRNFTTGDTLYYLDSITPGEGEAIEPDRGGFEWRNDGEVIINDAYALNIINSHGPIDGARDDFEVTKFAMEFCDDEKQAELEWNGIDVSGYSGTCTGRRIIDFDGYTPDSFERGYTPPGLADGDHPADSEGVSYPVNFSVDCHNDVTNSITATVSGEVVGWPPLEVLGYGGIKCKPVLHLDFDSSFRKENEDPTGEYCAADVEFTVECNPGEGESATTNTALVSAQAQMPVKTLTVMTGITGASITINSATFDCDTKTIDLDLDIDITTECKTIKYVGCDDPEDADCD